IDLVMREGDTLVFVEVRYRRDPRFGGGAASVGAAKQRRLVRAAQGFLSDRPRLARLPCRFDVVAFDGDADAPRCEWRRNAFDAS
ncbi:MAG: YraN family protein, partial [Rhodanobacteraceae bacterium]